MLRITYVPVKNGNITACFTSYKTKGNFIVAIIKVKRDLRNAIHNVSFRRFKVDRVSDFYQSAPNSGQYKLI